MEIIKNRPRLLGIGTLSKTNNRSKFKPTTFETIFPDLTFDENQGNAIYDAFVSKNVVAAMDGSVKDSMGAGALCLATRDGSILYKYNFPVPGEHNDVYSTRTEMFCNTGSVGVFDELTIFTDSKNAIKSVFEPIFLAIWTVFENDSDILSELKWNVQLYRFRICTNISLGEIVSIVKFAYMSHWIEHM